MTKAVLVLDMPENCGRCPISEYCHNNDGKCDLSVRQSWCPLKEIPNKKEYNNMYDPMQVLTYKDGWNACIDRILS